MNRGIAWLLSLSLVGFGPAALALSVFDVIELTRNGYDEAEIERLIEVTNARFMIDVDSLLALGEANVEDEIIALMLERGAMPAEELSETDQLIALREADFSEETIMRFVRHRNVCEPLADEDERRLGRAGFSSAFMRDFREQVEGCREERETLALIEPLPEGAYEETPTRATRVYRTDATAYPSTSTVRRPTTTYYPPSHYGVYDSYYYRDRITRVYPVVVYRDYGGHRHRHGKSGHRARDNDGRRHDRDRRRGDRDHKGSGRADDTDRRRKHDRDRRRGDRKGDRRRDRQNGDRDRGRRADSDTVPIRPQPRNDPNRRILVDDPSTTSPIGRRMGNGRQDRVTTRPFVRSGSRKGAATGLPTGAPNHAPVALPDMVRRRLDGERTRRKRSDRTVRPRSPGLPGDVRRRAERPTPDRKTPSWMTPPVRPNVSAPKSPAPPVRPVRTPPASPPPAVKAPPPRVPEQVEWEDF